LSELSLRGRC